MQCLLFSHSLIVLGAIANCMLLQFSSQFFWRYLFTIKSESCNTWIFLLCFFFHCFVICITIYHVQWVPDSHFSILLRRHHVWLILYSGVSFHLCLLKFQECLGGSKWTHSYAIFLSEFNEKLSLICWWLFRFSVHHSKSSLTNWKWANPLPYHLS